MAKSLKFVVNKGWLQIKNFKTTVVNKSSLLAVTKTFSNTLLIKKRFRTFFFINSTGGGVSHTTVFIYMQSSTALKILIFHFSILFHFIDSIVFGYKNRRLKV